MRKLKDLFKYRKSSRISLELELQGRAYRIFVVCIKVDVRIDSRMCVVKEDRKDTAIVGRPPQRFRNPRRHFFQVVVSFFPKQFLGLVVAGPLKPKTGINIDSERKYAVILDR